jgi:hypothetical protein
MLPWWSGGHGNNNKIPCQVYGKTGHYALCCYNRFDASYNGEEKQALVATTGYNVDTKWYTDIGANDHITFELNTLTTREKYHGSDQVHDANGSGMPIFHVVRLPFIAVIVILFLKISYMFQMTLKILFWLTSLHMIMVLSLNFILGICT